MEIKCKICLRRPKEMKEYRDGARDNFYDDADEYVSREEGTFNKSTGFFYCTKCYVNIGMPLGTA